MRDYDEEDNYDDEATSGLTSEELEDLKDCFAYNNYLNEMIAASYHL